MKLGWHFMEHTPPPPHVASRPDSGSWTPLTGLHIHTQTHRSRKDSTGRVISPKHRPLPTTHSTHKRQISMAPAGFEPAIPASERSQSHALNGAATSIGRWMPLWNNKLCNDIHIECLYKEMWDSFIFIFLFLLWCRTGKLVLKSLTVPPQQQNKMNEWRPKLR